MSQFNLSDPNSIINQLVRTFVIQEVRYVSTLCYTFSVSKRSCRFSPIDKVASYSDNPHEPFRCRARQPLYPIAFLAITAALVTIAGIWMRSFSFFSSNSDYRVLQPDHEWFFYSLVMAVVLAFYMVVATGRSQRFTYFINYYSYVIGTLWFVLISFLLFTPMMCDDVLEPIWNQSLMTFEFFKLAYFIFGISAMFYLFVVHPVLTFRNLVDLNIRRMVLIVSPLGSGVLLFGYVLMSRLS